MPSRRRREREPHRLRGWARPQGTAAPARRRLALTSLGTVQADTLRIVASERGLQRLEWTNARSLGPRTLVDDAQTQLEEYFAGRRTTFDLPLDPVGTAFQQRAWLALTKIPYGETRTYAEQALLLGLSRAAARAVGNANARNPLPVVVPCHRLVGASGSLTGYAGGLDRKERLLRLEGALR